MADIAQLGVAIDSTAFLAMEANANRATAAVERNTEALARGAGVASSSSRTQAAAQATVTESTVQSTTAAERLLATVQKQITLFGASTDAVARYNGALAQMMSAELALYEARTLELGGLREQAAAENALAAARTSQAAAQTRFLDGLREEAATLGLSRAELQLYRAEQLGVAEAALPLITGLEDRREALARVTQQTQELGETEEAATARIAAMVEQSLAAAAAMNDNTAAAQRYAQSLDELAASASAAEISGAASTASTSATNPATAAAYVGGGAAVASATREATTAAREGAVAEDAYNESVVRMQTSWERQAFAVSATREELAKYDAELAGASAEQAEYIASLAALVDAQRGATTGFVAVRTELLVLGRELASGNIARFGGSLTRLIGLLNVTQLLFNPITIALAAVGVAAVEGGKQFRELQTAVESTGDVAGVSAGKLQDMINGITEAGNRAGVATEAITKLAQTGRFTGDQIRSIGTAATEWSEVTGTAVDKVVQEFAKLAEDPVKASVELNNQYHYLTLAVFEQIDALQKQGDAVGAADAAQKAYADALHSRADEIKGDLAPIPELWKAIEDAASGAWNQMLNVGKPQTLQQQLDDVTQSIAAARGDMADTSDIPSRLAREAAGQAVTSTGGLAHLQQTQADLQEQQRFAQRQGDRDAEEAASNKAAIAAQQGLEALDKAHAKHQTLQDDLAKEAKLEADLRAKDTTSPLLSAQAVADRVAGIERADRERQTPGTAGTASAERQQPLEELKSQYAEQTHLLEDQRKVLDDDHQARLRSDQAFFQAERDLNTQDLAAKLGYYDRLEALLQADMASSTTSNAQKIRDAAQIKAVHEDQNVALADYLVSQQKVADQVVEANNRQTSAVKKYTDAMQALIDKENEADQRRLDAAGLTRGQRAGPQALVDRDALRAQQIISEIQAKTAPAVGPAGPGQTIPADQSAKLVAQVQADLATISAASKATTEQIAQNNESWSSGAIKAWDNWSAQAENVTGQVNSATTGLLNGLSDQLVKFAETGKANFEGLAASFVSALAKMEIQAAESQVFKLINGSLPGGSAGGAFSALLSLFGSTSAAAGLGLGTQVGGIGGAIAASAGYQSATAGLSAAAPLFHLAAGGHVTGPGSGTSDSIPARLSNGEFVVNAEATARNRPLLEAMNGGRGSFPGKTHFADGGYVSPGGAGGGGTNIAFHITNSAPAGGDTSSSASSATRNAALQKQLEAAVIEVVRKNSLPGGQINSIIKTAATR